MERYIGSDVRARFASERFVGRGHRRTWQAHASLASEASIHVIDTNGQALVEFFKMQPGAVHVCMEEGTQSTCSLRSRAICGLSAHVETISVVNVTESRGQKDDARDAHTLAEELRTGAIGRTVYKQTCTFTTLRALTKMHTMVVQDCNHTLKDVFKGVATCVIARARSASEG